MIHFNLGSHDGRTLEDLTSLVEATEKSSAAHGAQRDSATELGHLASFETKPQINLPAEQAPQVSDFDSQRSGPAPALPETRCPASVPQLCSDPTGQTDDVCNAPVFMGKSFCLAHEELEEEYAD